MPRTRIQTVIPSPYKVFSRAPRHLGRCTGSICFCDRAEFRRANFSADYTYSLFRWSPRVSVCVSACVRAGGGRVVSPDAGGRRVLRTRVSLPESPAVGDGSALGRYRLIAH